jgi:hypothetical protein
MFELVVTRACRARKALVAVLLAAVSAGCSGEGGTVAPTPTDAPGVAASPKAVPRVPRGPDAAKALQDQVPKKQ